MKRFLKPSEINNAVRPKYKDYLQNLYKYWHEADHPDVNQFGQPRSRRIERNKRASLMRERIGHIADKVPTDEWHRDCFSPRSSQALVVHVLGLLAEADKLDLITRDITRLVPHTVAFEKPKGRTHFDAVLCNRNGKILATIESKFTEKGFSNCSYPKGANPRCDGTWWARPGIHRGCPMAAAKRNRSTANRYWDALNEYCGVPTSPPRVPETCPLWAPYQAVHNLAETRQLETSARWILLYDIRNPYFTDAHVGWIPQLEQFSKRNIHLLSWQQVFKKVVNRIPELVQVQRLHGFGV